MTGATGTSLRWYQGIPRYAWMVLAVAACGWLFDTMDQNIFTLVRQPAVTALLTSHLNAAPLDADVARASGVSTAVFLLGWAAGGFVFGILGDRLGRMRTMALTVTIYAVFTGLTALAHTILWFNVLRFLTALGVGGEWAAGAAIVAEVWPDRSRAMALGVLQALSSVGNMLAGVVTLVLSSAIPGSAMWRWAFAVGFLPALLVVWIRRSVREPDLWLHARDRALTGAGAALGDIAGLFTEARLRRNTIAAVLMAGAGVAGLWGVGFWTPELTSVVVRRMPHTPQDLQRIKSIVYMAQQAGSLCGMLAYSVLCRSSNRRRPLGWFLVLSYLSVQGMFWTARTVPQLIAWAPVLGFCTLGPFAAYTIYFPELFPTRLRATGIGFCYNCARVFAAAAPFALGEMASSMNAATHGNGFRAATSAVSLVYGIGLAGVAMAPETAGAPLPD